MSNGGRSEQVPGCVPGKTEEESDSGVLSATDDNAARRMSGCRAVGQPFDTAPLDPFLHGVGHDGAMNIESRIEFAADPDQVFTMLTDQGYLEEVCRACESIEYDASTEGATTVSSRKLPAPDSAKRFVGSTLTVVEKVDWSAANDDKSRTGAVDMSVPGQPVTLRGSYQLHAGGRGSVVTLTGELKVNVPLLGKKLEQSAAPAVLAGFETQQQVGDDWLTSH